MIKNFFEDLDCRCSKQSKQCCPCCNQIQMQNSCVGLEPFFCPRLRTYVLRGPRGFTGPRGPQGLPGVSPLVSFASFSFPQTQTVTSNSSILLNNVITQSGNRIKLTNGVINLEGGAYLVNYNLNAKANGEQVMFALAINNEVDSNSQIIIQNETKSLVSCGSNTIISVGSMATLAIKNLSSQEVITQNVSISILKLA